MPRTPLSVLRRNRDFRNLFTADLIGLGADWFVMIPLLTLLPGLTGSGLWGALVLAVDTGVTALLLPYTGTIADRVDRRRIVLAADLAMAAFALLLLLVRTPATAWVALVAVGALAVAKAFFIPAAQAALPNVVDPEDLPAANTLAGSAWGTMLVIGASLGGIAAQAFGAYPCFVIASVLLLFAALQVFRVRRPMQAARAGAPAPAFAAIAEALRYIRGNPRVASLVTVKSAVGLGNGVLTLFPLLGAGPLGTGLLFAARGLGALTGPILFRRVLTHRAWLLPGLALSMAVYGLAYLGVSLVTWFPLMAAGVTVAHLAAGGNFVMSNFVLQAEVPDALRGRIFAADFMLATLTVAASQLVVGAFVDRASPRLLLAACGAVTLLYAAVWSLIVLRRSVQTQPPVNAAPPIVASQPEQSRPTAAAPKSSPAGTAGQP
ncbi:MFS transporter [Dactylosporangium sp. CS-033363]|uniref:MFS transporter n=1 Tax=Dactylosporangium sp. CS-033363 TaxID=3239935 RepID=UPI003D8C7FA4